MNSKLLATASISVAAMFTSAKANTITGYLWRVPEATAQIAILANVPELTPDVVFDVDSPFSFSGTSATVGDWLASSGAFNVVENTAGALSSLMDDGSHGTLVKFSGLVSVETGQTFTVTHDDGLTLTIGGIDVVSRPFPSAPVTEPTTYTGPSGTFPFELVYGECCGGLAVLQLDLPLSNPCLLCPATFTVCNDAGVCGAMVTYPAPRTDGTCGTITCQPPAGTFLPVGLTVVNCTGTDQEGAILAECDFIVRVQDCEPLTIICPANVTQPNDLGECSVVVNDIDPVQATDNCPGVTLYYDLSGATTGSGSGSASGQTLNNGVTTVTYTAIDGQSQSVSCSFTVTVPGPLSDTTPPVITLNGTDPLTLECRDLFSDPGATATDRCPAGVPVTSSGLVEPDMPGSYTILYSATDGSGNTATATRTVTVVDTVAPTIVLINGNSLFVLQHTAFADPGAFATDFCSGSLPVSASGTVDVETAGSYILTYTATDPSGNTATVIRTVTVVDFAGIHVSLEPSSQTIDFGGSASMDLVISGLGDHAFPSLGAFSFDLSYDPTILLPVSVAFGNQLDLGLFGSFLFSDLSTPGVIHLEEVSFESAETLNAAQPSSFTLATLSFTGVGVGLGTITIVDGILFDGDGFSLPPFTSSAGQIQVNDRVPVCPQAQVVCNDPGACTAVVALVLPTQPPNFISVICTRNDQLSLSEPYPLGVTTITCTGTDTAGGTATCGTTVTVNDCEAPDITCPADQFLVCGSSTNPDNTGSGTATDNCPDTVTIAFTDAAMTPNCTGQAGIDRTWTATDLKGNITRCVQHIRFVDTTPPVITCPSDVIVTAGPSCSAAVAYPTPTVMDNCGGSVLVACHPPSGSIFAPGETPVTCTATDSCGNTVTCAFAVTVQRADLRISESVVSGQAKPGQTLIYTITVANLGPATATSVVVKDAVPEGTTFLSAKPAGTYAAPPIGEGGLVRWEVGTLSSGESAEVNLNVIVTARGNDLITNKAAVESGTCEANSGDNTATLTSKRRTVVSNP